MEASCAMMSNYYKAIIIKTAWYLHKNRNNWSMEQKENPEITTFMYVQIAKNIQYGKDGHLKR